MNYIDDYPLNLIGRVALVTSASSELSAAICRSLLNSNAFVLGVDSKPAHETTKATIAPHFQYLEYEKDEGITEKEISDKIKRGYLKDRVDFLIDVVQGTKDKLPIVDVEYFVNHLKTHNGVLLQVLDETANYR